MNGLDPTLHPPIVEMVKRCFRDMQAPVSLCGPALDTLWQKMCIRDRSKDREYLEKCYTEGAEKACRATAKMLRKVYKKVGFIGL